MTEIKFDIKKISLNIVRIIIPIIILASLLLGQKNDNSLAQNEYAHKFGASFMTMNNPFFSVINESIKAIVEANGDILITRDPALDAERQIEQISEMIDDGVEALFVAPVDYEKILPIVEQAKNKGIYIIFVDTEVYDDGIADGIVLSDNYRIGVYSANFLMKNKSHADILILEHKRTKSANDRVAGFSDTLASNENYRIVGSADTAGQLEVAMPIMKDILAEGLEFDTVFAINDSSALGAMAALEDENKLAQVSVLGVDGAPEAKAMIKENIMLETVAQYPSKIGKTAAEQLYCMLRNESYDKKILVPASIITKDNVDAFGLEGWQ